MFGPSFCFIKEKFYRTATPRRNIIEHLNDGEH